MLIEEDNRTLLTPLAECRSDFHFLLLLIPRKLFFSHILFLWRCYSQKTENGIEGISVKDAFDAVTINAAKVLGVDDEIGSITAGKLANFVILDKNPLKVDPLELKDIKIERTVYSGRDFKLPEIDSYKL